MTEEDLTPLPPLHPRRLAQALDHLLHARTQLTDVDLDTCRCALRQIQRTQQAIGFTGEVADLGTNLVKAAGSFSKLIRKRQ